MLRPQRRATMRTISEIVRDHRPLTLSPRTSVKHACQSMRDRHVGAVLVTDKDQKLVGIFTGRDAVYKVLAEGRDAMHTTLSEVMTRAPKTMPPAMSAIEALRLMSD